MLLNVLLFIETPQEGSYLLSCSELKWQRSLPGRPSASVDHDLVTLINDLRFILQGGVLSAGASQQH